MTTAQSIRSVFRASREVHTTHRRIPRPSTARWVEEVLIRGRYPWRVGEPTRVLGQLIRDRLDHPRAAEDDASEEIAMQAVLEAWHARRSHALEWLIIALIALDIAIHMR